MNFAKLDRYRSIIDDWDAFEDALSRPLPTCVWANPLKTTPERLEEWMEAGGLPYEPLSWRPGAYRVPSDVSSGNRLEYIAGLYHVQEEASLLPVELLNPQPYERILDMCAAPGNKTVQIGVRMKNTGTVVANDRDYRRMKGVSRSSERLGLLNVSLTTFDAGNLSAEAGLFDRVLADVPCCCEGTSRKNPEVLDPTRHLPYSRLGGVQRAILKKAIQLCRPGGRIVYSTCTYAPEENELVLDAVLRDLEPGVVRLLPARIPGFKSAPGLTHWEGQSLNPELTNAMRVYPHHNDTGGFFVAVLERLPLPEPQDDAQAPDRTARLSTPALADVVEIVDPKPTWAMLDDRFGMSPKAFAGLELVQTNPKTLAIVNADHLPTARPLPQGLGIPFLHVKMEFPKLTTAAAMTFGLAATKNVIELTPEQVDAFWSRQDFALQPGQASLCSGRGYVILCHRDVALGLGFFVPPPEDSAPAHHCPGMVRSMFPKAWSLSNQRSAFGE